MNTQQPKAADDARRDNKDRDETNDTQDRKERQEELLDEGVEETFPASDPVSVKRIT